MSQSVRQNNLFAAEDFENIYRSFSQIDFQAYDFDSLKAALVEYVQTQYPEDYNDYIESAEFIATIELLAYLGTSLAFRVDLNSRENFIDTAERRESIINLARQINYNASRNLSAKGTMKVVGIQTTEPLQDSQGTDLSNLTVFWNDPNNENSTDQFITILNAAFNSTNPFGKPFKRGTIADIPTDLYKFDSVQDTEVSYNVSIDVNNEATPIDVVNVDFEDGLSFTELHPDPSNSFGILYRNDGQGLSSTDTGFFFYFKQGTLQTVDNQYDFPLKNRVTEIDVTKVNETDVWVQEINQAGNVIEKWTKVPSVDGGSNIIYNDINLGVRSIYEVLSRVDDQISIKYPDGNFGDVPSGIFRTWLRNSVGEAIIIRPEDATNVEITIPYTGKDGQIYELRTVMSLQYTVTNASPAETNEEVKVRAPQVYYTQDRMVNNKDYNVFPLLNGNEILKIKTTNRTNSGQSRYIDINDPTGFNQNLTIFADDGALYVQDAPQIEQVPIDNNVNESRTIVTTNLDNFLDSIELTNYFYNTYLADYVRVETELGNPEPFKYSGVPYYWGTYPQTNSNNTGFLTQSSTGTNEGNLFNYEFQRNDGFEFMDIGSKIMFASGSDTKQATITSIITTTDGNDVASQGARDLRASVFILDTNIPKGYEVTSVIPRFRTSFTEAEIISISAEIEKTSNFGLQYNINEDPSGAWLLVDNIDTEDEFRLDVLDQSWLISCQFNSAVSAYNFRGRGLDYVFESQKEVRFYFDPDQKNFDTQTLQASEDVIELLESNLAPTNNEDWIRDSSLGTWMYTDVSYQQNIVYLTGRNASADKLNITYQQYNIDDDSYYPAITVSNDIINEDIAQGFIDTEKVQTAYNPIGFGDNDKLTIAYDNQSSLEGPIRYNIFDVVYDSQGFLDPTKTKVTPADNDGDGVPDDIFAYQRFVPRGSLVFLERITSENKSEPLVLWTSSWVDLRKRDISTVTAEELNNKVVSLILISSSQKAEFISKLSEIVNEEMLGVVVYTERRDIRNDVVTVNDYHDDLIPLTNSVDYLIFETIDNQIEINLTRDTAHEVRDGRTFTQDSNVVAADKQEVSYKWQHYAPTDHRIDPSVSNIMDMIILTNSYFKLVEQWKSRGLTTLEFPTAPTTQELRVQFQDLNEFKMMSDQIVYKSGKFKLLFGGEAAPELQALFKVVKLTSSTATDNEVKAGVISAIDEYFNINNWDFGETFYYTELAAYIHQSMTNSVSSVVIVPVEASSEFGNLFQINAESNELFLSTATVQNVQIVQNLNETNMRL